MSRKRRMLRRGFSVDTPVNGNGTAPKMVGFIKIGALADGSCVVESKGLRPLAMMQLMGAALAQLAGQFHQQKQSPIVAPSGDPIPNLRGN